MSKHGKTNKTTYKLGESVYCAVSGRFLGDYVENLTDFINGETFEFFMKRKCYGPIDYHQSPEGRIPIYSRRKVFSFRFGTVEQILKDNGIDGDLAWINI